MSAVNPSSQPVATGAVKAFSTARFMALLRVDMAERWRSYAAFMAVTLVIHVLVLITVFGNSRDLSPMGYSSQSAAYYGFLLAFGAAFACLLFAPLQRQGAALLTLVRPASRLEKWLHAVVMMLLLFPLVYTLGFWLTYVPVNALAAVSEARMAAREAAMGNTVTVDGFQWFVPMLFHADGYRSGLGVQWLFVWSYWVLCGFAAFALVLFHRAAAIKALGVALVLGLLTILALSMGPGTGDMDGLMMWLSAKQRAQMGALEIVTCLLFWLVTPALVWWASYRAWVERDLA